MSPGLVSCDQHTSRVSFSISGLLREPVGLPSCHWHVNAHSYFRHGSCLHEYSRNFHFAMLVAASVVSKDGKGREVLVAFT